MRYFVYFVFILFTCPKISICSALDVTPSRDIERVLIIVLENTDQKRAIKEPYLASLCNQGICYTNMQATTHPSQPNYIAMVAGDTLGVSGNGSRDLNELSIADLIEAKGLDWRAYAEGYPGNCFKGGSKNKYARKHAPFISFLPISQDSSRCAKILPATQFAHLTLPAYTFYTPDLNNDGHDTGVGFASRWLEGFLRPIFADSEWMAHSVVVVTFDEDGGGNKNMVYTAIIGAGIPAGIDTRRHTHFDLLRTIEDELGLGTMGRRDLQGHSILP